MKKATAVIITAHVLLSGSIVSGNTYIEAGQFAPVQFSAKRVEVDFANRRWIEPFLHQGSIENIGCFIEAFGLVSVTGKSVSGINTDPATNGTGAKTPWVKTVWEKCQIHFSTCLFSFLLTFFLAHVAIVIKEAAQKRRKFNQIIKLLGDCTDNLLKQKNS